MGRRIGTKAKRQPPADAPALVPPRARPSSPERPDDILATMAAAVADRNPVSAAEALRLLRLAYPHHPLALRLAALAIVMKRSRAGGFDFASPGLRSSAMH